jgi:hypothetical protein
MFARIGMMRALDHSKPAPESLVGVLHQHAAY